MMIPATFTVIRALIGAKRVIKHEIRLLKHEVIRMADALADLTAAVTAISASVTEAGDQIKAETAKILDLLANPPATGVDPVAVEAAVTSINALAGGLHDAVVTAQGALAPAPAPEPVPAPVEAPASDAPAA